jgi:hypothetical protein
MDLSGGPPPCFDKLSMRALVVRYGRQEGVGNPGDSLILSLSKDEALAPHVQSRLT